MPQVQAEAEPLAQSKLPDTVQLTPDGGKYYRAVVFWYTITAIAMPIVAVALVIAILNPFWFRDGFFRWVESSVNKLAKWRNYRQYALYLGCDPEYWHTLRG
jgi:hypothetical protein